MFLCEMAGIRIQIGANFRIRIQIHHTGLNVYGKLEHLQSCPFPSTILKSVSIARLRKLLKFLTLHRRQTSALMAP